MAYLSYSGFDEDYLLVDSTLSDLVSDCLVPEPDLCLSAFFRSP
jgi:hypothetical protein